MTRPRGRAISSRDGTDNDMFWPLAIHSLVVHEKVVVAVKLFNALPAWALRVPGILVG